MSYKKNELIFSPSTIIVLKNKIASEVVRELIESGNQRDPFHCFDINAAYDCVLKFKNKMPRVQIFYAMKANDHSMMLKLAIALGLGFDCASPGEINKIRKYNVHPARTWKSENWISEKTLEVRVIARTRHFKLPKPRLARNRNLCKRESFFPHGLPSIIYAAPMKTREQMIFARKSGVRHTTFDSLCELNRLKKHWPDSRLLIRVKLDSDCVYRLGDKFGCDCIEAMSLLDEASRLGMNVIGVAFHVGSACFSPQSYTQGLQVARALFDYEAREGRHMSLLDIGGGYFNDDHSFDKVAGIINSGLARWFPDQEVQVIAEPGRYICESAFTLYTNIRYTRTIIDSDKTTKMVYLNNGSIGVLRFVEKWHNINKFMRTKDIRQTKDDDAQNTIMWGPTLDDRDVLGPVKLPSLSVRDWLVFSSQGAYCRVFRSEYCKTDKNYTLCVMSEDLWFTLKDKTVFSKCSVVTDSKMASTNKLPSTLPLNVSYGEKFIMNGCQFEGFKTLVTPAYVLEQYSPDDVSRAMIERGEQTQPFYIFNMDEAHRRVQHFQQMMPRVKIFYAVKSNDTDMMLRLIVALGLGFDCASPGEIHKIRKLNVNPESIIYAMPCKTTEEMEYARRTGVKHTTFDSSYELKKLKKSWPDARLLLRIKIDGTAKKKLGLKFGCNFESEAIALLDEAASLGLNVAGVAFHVGSICYSPESYMLGLKQARALFDHEARNGRKMDIVDIGGGFLSDRTDNIDEVSCLINKTLEELFPDPAVQIVAEPGRYLSDSAFKMFCNIIGVRQVVRKNKPVNMIYLNNGVYGTMRFDENWHKISKFQRSGEIDQIVDQQIILWGPTCDSIDLVMQNHEIKLPKCSPNDWLFVDIHGAYTFSFSTRFSSIELPLIRSVISKDLWNSIRKSSVFQPSDFVVNPDISAPLPSTLPTVLPTCTSYDHSDIPTLKV